MEHISAIFRDVEAERGSWWVITWMLPNPRLCDGYDLSGNMDADTHRRGTPALELAPSERRSRCAIRPKTTYRGAVAGCIRI